MRKIQVGLLGLGTVGMGVYKLLRKRAETMDKTIGAQLEIKKTAFKVTRVGQLVAGEASQRLGIPFGIVDLSLAPTPAIGDSVAEILEEIGLERVGAPGTTAALAMLNDQVKKGGEFALYRCKGRFLYRRRAKVRACPRPWRPLTIPECAVWHFR